jgi:glutaminyl-peptide cyclotransferase
VGTGASPVQPSEARQLAADVDAGYLLKTEIPIHVNIPVAVSWPFMSRHVCSILLFLGALAASAVAQPLISAPADTYQIIHSYLHDPEAFTQGLIYLDGRLYESTGLNGRSSLRMVDLSTGRVLQKYDVPAEYFGEGLTDWGSNLIQLTWKAHKGFVYDRFSFSLLRTFSYEGEGWGLTHDRTQLIMSDGTSYLRFLDPKSFRETRRIHVTDAAGRAIDNLNELEYIHGEIYANIWGSNVIVRVSPRTGKVLGRIDLTGIIDKRELAGSNAVLNGIAYDSAGDRLFVTGKLWPKLFEIRVVTERRKAGTGKGRTSSRAARR